MDNRSVSISSFTTDTPGCSVFSYFQIEFQIYDYKIDHYYILTEYMMRKKYKERITYFYLKFSIRRTLSLRLVEKWNIWLPI